MLVHVAARDEADIGAAEQFDESPTVVGRNETVIDVRLAGMQVEERLVHEERDRPAGSHRRRRGEESPLVLLGRHSTAEELDVQAKQDPASGLVEPVVLTEVAAVAL